MQHNHRMELFACDASKDFACRVIEELNKIQREDFEGPYHIGDMKVVRFSDGEFQPQYDAWTHLRPFERGYMRPS